jgi:hypothetical protein
MLADDFCRGVTDDFPRATVPAGQVSGGVKTKSCMITNVLNKDLKAPFGTCKSRLRLVKIEL